MGGGGGVHDVACQFNEKAISPIPSFANSMKDMTK